MKKSRQLTFIDFCSGIGGGRLGLEQVGMKCLAHSEINSDADFTYKLFFDDENNLGDLTQIDVNNIPNCDILIAGFPCQTFSIVGKREGFEDDRGQIIYHLAKILKEKNIPYFIFENVKGLTNHNSGKTLKKILKLLDESGYNVSYKVINSIDFGVPQLRERVYFVGIRKDLYKKPFEFPFFKNKSSISDYLVNIDNEEQDIAHPTFKKYLSNKYNMGRINLSELLKKDYLIIDTRQSDLRTFDGHSPTLRTGRHGILYVKNNKLYKLSGVEALLLQGFPEKLALKANILPRNKVLSQAGNAMTVNVISAIGNKLQEYIGVKDINELDRTWLANCS